MLSGLALKTFSFTYPKEKSLKETDRGSNKFSPIKPVGVFDKPLHSPKVTVWCGLSSNRVYGPYFFQDPDGKALTVTSDTYIEMLNTMFTGDIYPDRWFQQDGATAHTSLRSRTWLNSRFGNHVISHPEDFSQVPRSVSFRLFSLGVCKGECFQSKTR